MLPRSDTVWEIEYQILHIIASTTLAFALRDTYPATQLHTLVIPKRHACNFLRPVRA